MPERVADAIEEMTRSDRDDQQEKPQIQADPALRRPRPIRNTAATVVACLVVATGVLSGAVIYWLLDLPAVADRPGLTVVRQLPVRIAVAVVVAAVVAGLVAWIFRPAPTLRRTVRNWITTSRRRTAHIPLFVSVAAAVLVGVGLAAVMTRAVTGSYLELETPATAVAVLKAALPAVAGAAIAVALVLLYRRQKDSERGQFAQRFGAASAQLGDSDVAVRVSGVYAMAAVADEAATFAHRQQCIDVLCGYLRLPYDPNDGANHLSEFISTTTWSATAPATNIEEQRRQAIRQNDREVRKTIVRVVTRHLQRNADTSWSGNDFDFTGVLFEDASFEGATFGGRHVSFGAATFTGEKTSFEHATFNAETVSFVGAKFDSPTSFGGATFRASHASFDAARFGGRDISFDGARFAGEYVSFVRGGFTSEKTSFKSARFKCLRASFDLPAEWKTVEFDWDNPSGDNAPAIPRCITPRPWPPNLPAAE
jgi:Pentapeptide repeats (9 copies)